MGCGASARNTAGSAAGTYPGILIPAGKKTPEEPISDNLLDLKNEYICLWFDPHKDSNTEFAKRVRGDFKDLRQLTTKEDFVKELASANAQRLPLFVISCGSKYQEIKSIAEENEMVDIIVIFCYEKDTHDHFKKEHRKVADVISNPKDLYSSFKNAVKTGSYAHQRLLRRFIENMDERSFYMLESEEDKNMILDCVRVTKDEYEGPNIFYPLSFDAYKVKPSKWKITCQMMKELSNKCDFHPSLVSQRKEAETVLDSLKEMKMEGKELQREIVQAYTAEGLCYLMNYCMRKAEPDKVKVFAEYGYLLRGSMSILGIPVSAINSPSCNEVYRGITLTQKQIDAWKAFKGRYVLTPQYTSTTMDRSITERFINSASQSGKQGVLMIISFTDETKQFIENLGVLSNLYNGIYYPVDIQGCSKFPKEKEILFPPFYPWLIKDVTKNENKAEQYIMRIEAPRFLSFGKMRQGEIVKPGEKQQPLSPEIGKAIRNRAMDLIKQDLMKVVDLQGCFTRDDESVECFNKLMSACKDKKITAFNASIFPRFEESFSELHNDHLIGIMNDLTDLRLISCNVSDKTVQIISEALIKEGSKLKILMLDGNKITDKGAKALAKALEIYKNLTVLDLGNSSNIEVSEGWTRLCKAIKEDKVLEDISFNTNSTESIPKEYQEALAEGVRNKPNLRKQRIDLGELCEETLWNLVSVMANNTSFTELGTYGYSDEIKKKMGSLFVPLLENKKKLINLQLDGIKVEDKAVGTLAKVIQQNPNLERLYLLGADLSGESASLIADVIKKLLSKSTPLYLLNLGGNQFGATEIAEIARVLAANKSLKIFEFSNNKIKDEGAKEFAAMLVQNTTLAKLCLEKNEIKADGGKAIAEALNKNQSLTSLSLDDNLIGDDGCVKFGLMLPSNYTLEGLSVRNNNITDIGGTELLNGLQNNKTLKKIEIRDNNISYIIGSAILKAGESNE